ncbi:beta-lactamase [Burkholderia thailandensis MSMB121]|uniref:class C beta-lactamase n=1 Tax=Burkholderia humptydooensis TaxID=430531 RepID=UPI000327F047|nr:class C beta-lactamase [Burkholderia humptydooensis]AGK50479.1 beta-lactamase [Burkholderia thailandensis MSMB121]ATF33539.1 class C beta-lactamase [Burkholderia thailandensis]KST71611.1 class C beta-lactamase [Burkholderia humptydooensis]
MRKRTQFVIRMWLALSCCLAIAAHAARSIEPADVGRIVDAVAQPLQEKYGIPGLAIAVSIDGRHYFYNYGVASTATRRPVTGRTLFEIGSLSKTFTATLAAYAQEGGELSLADSVSRYLPALQGSSFDRISLLNMGTQTSGLPLFVPDTITNTAELLDYLKNWRPDRAPGTHRVYSNLGIGTLGMIAAASMNERFETLIEKNLFPEFRMLHSYIDVPAERRGDDAQGYTKQGAPIRLRAGMLASEAYGVRSCATDLIRFVDANMGLVPLSDKWARAMKATHVGYYEADGMIQSLIWEQYPYPVSLGKLLAGNDLIGKDVVAKPFDPPLPPRQDVWINKTGSTNGFSTYVAFVPSKKVGVVILANKSYPLNERVTIGYTIIDSIVRAER